MRGAGDKLLHTATHDVYCLKRVRKQRSALSLARPEPLGLSSDNSAPTIELWSLLFTRWGGETKDGINRNYKNMTVKLIEEKVMGYTEKMCTCGEIEDMHVNGCEQCFVPDCGCSEFEEVCEFCGGDSVKREVEEETGALVEVAGEECVCQF